MEKNVQIQTTSICNGSCKICPYVGSYLSKHKAVMADQVFDRIVSEVRRCISHIPKLPLYMQNEPLTDPKLFDRIGKIRKILSVGTLEISTNCLLLNGDRGRGLLEALQGQKSSVILSFHGHDKESFEKMMGLSFERCLDNLREFLLISDGIGIKRSIYSCGSEAVLMKFWQGILYPLKLRKKPIVKVFGKPNNRAGNVSSSWANQVHERKLKRCVRRDKWVHFNWRGEIIICCNDYENEAVLGDIRTHPLNGVLSIAPTVIGKLSKDPNFICYRCDRRMIGQ